MMRVLLLLFFLCATGLSNPYQAWVDPNVELVFRGTGLESGHVLDLTVRNKGSETVAFQLPQLTVLASDKGFTPIVVESKGGWRIPPGAEVSHRVIGYSLEQSLPGPGRGRVAS